MNISYKIGNGTFNFRVAGVLMYDNKVLLSNEEGFDFWCLPGGRVTIFESTEQAIKREIFEELGTMPTIERLLWVAESMFYLNLSGYGNVHEVCFYYLMCFTKDSEVYQKESFVVHEAVGDKTKLITFKWFDIASLEAVNFKPMFLKKRMMALPLAPEHIMVNELELNKK